MDESVVGIAAALHAAFASKATRWLDLDGSFDRSRDFASGDFAPVDGVLRTLDSARPRRRRAGSPSPNEAWANWWTS